MKLSDRAAGETAGHGCFLLCITGASCWKLIWGKLSTQQGLDMEKAACIARAGKATHAAGAGCWRNSSHCRHLPEGH